GTLAAAVHFLAERGAHDITALTLLSAPEGIELCRQELSSLTPPVTLVTGSIDERLNDHGYLVPGLGDAGDRRYSVIWPAVRRGTGAGPGVGCTPAAPRDDPG